MAHSADTIPDTMRAVVIDRFGPPEVLHIARIPVPTAGPGEVLVRVHAAGVNAIDWKTRKGGALDLPFPAVLGWDISGTVLATGPGVTAFRTGDEVFGMPRFPDLVGGYAEYVAAPADGLAAKPANVSHQVAAGAPMNAVTAWQSLFQHGGVRSGQRVLIHGAAGGVGHLAVQLAVEAGAEVIGTASAANRDFLLGLGASKVIDYRTERVADERDIDVVLDPRGGEDFRMLLEVLRPGGTIVTLVGRGEENERLAHARDLRVGYTYVGPDSRALAEIAKRLAAETLHIEIERVLPLADAAAAHALGEQGHVRGRLILDVLGE